MFLSCLTNMKIDNRCIIICGLEFKNEQKFLIKVYDFKGEELRIKNNSELNNCNNDFIFFFFFMKPITIRNDI